MNFEDLSQELQEKVKACKTPEELLALANEQGYELSEEELEAVSGGKPWLYHCTCDSVCVENDPGDK